jgi:hypothetical protein
MKRNARTSPFEWHFHREGFDHAPWWSGKSKMDIPRIAAIWEVIRRSPEVEKCHRPGHVPRTEFEHFVREHGSKSWVSLNRKERDDLDEALSELPPQHGFDPRPVYSITLESVDQKSGAPLQAALCVDEEFRRRADAESRKLM